jgi:hypothetical protein
VAQQENGCVARRAAKVYLQVIARGFLLVQLYAAAELLELIGQQGAQLVARGLLVGRRLHQHQRFQLIDHFGFAWSQPLLELLQLRIGCSSLSLRRLSCYVRLRFHGCVQ